METKEKSAKRKHKKVEITNAVLQQSGAEDVGQKLRKKSSKHLVEVISQTPKEERDNTLEAVETPAAEVDNAKKTKKRKRNDTDSDYRAQSGDKKEELIQQLPSKKRKNRTEFADPREDSTLNNQSRKALEYAFMQMNKPSKWKFNKARQNWIIRNLWSPETVPETYLPLTLRYLSKVQGGSRMKLMEEARTILQPPPPPDPETSPGKTVKFSEPGIETTTMKAKPVPGPLITTDPTPGSLLDSEPTAVVKVSKTHALAKVKTMRAQKLLEVLSSSNENA